jgi:hypothetical protein
MRFASLLALLVLASSTAFGQCPGGRCPATRDGSRVAFAQVPVYVPAVRFVQAPGSVPCQAQPYPAAAQPRSPRRTILGRIFRPFRHYR